MKKDVEITGKFKSDLKRAKKRGCKLTNINYVIEILTSGNPLSRKYKPHKLSGNWSPKWECHIEPDWLLIYEETKDRVILHRTGTHSDLFR